MPWGTIIKAAALYSLMDNLLNKYLVIVTHWILNAFYNRAHDTEQLNTVNKQFMQNPGNEKEIIKDLRGKVRKQQQPKFNLQQCHLLFYHFILFYPCKLFFLSIPPVCCPLLIFQNYGGPQKNVCQYGYIYQYLLIKN